MTWRFSEVGIKLRLETLTPNERAKSNDRLLFDVEDENAMSDLDGEDKEQTDAYECRGNDKVFQ
jgi:hypothetical protein